MSRKYIPLFPLIHEQVKLPVLKRKAPELALELELPVMEYDITRLYEKKNSDEEKSGEAVIGWDRNDLDCFIID
jgi:hypothetical protein